MSETNDRGHSRYGGSSIGAVIACAASATASAAMPTLPDGGYSAEGTWAHALAAYCLEQGYRDASGFHNASLPSGVEVPTQYSGVVCGKDLCDAVQVYLDAVFAEWDLTPDAEIYVETIFDLPSAAAPGEVWGQVDALVYHPSLGRVRAFDYKHGVGVSVSPDDNAQPKFYATGAILDHPDWRVSEIVCTIVQPRARDADDVGAVKDWTFDTADLLDFMEQVETAIERSKSAAALFFTVGDHCRWRGVCWRTA